MRQGIDPRFPMADPPIYSRWITGPIETLRRWEDVDVTGEIWLPIPVAPLGQAIVKPEPVRFSMERMVNAPLDVMAPGPTVLGGHYDEVVCRPQRLMYRQRIPGHLWREKVVRHDVEDRVRHELARALAARFMLQLRAEPVDNYAERMMWYGQTAVRKPARLIDINLA